MMAGSVTRTCIAFLPRLRIAARKLPIVAEFSFRTVAARAVARRTIAMRSIAALSKAFTTRRIGALFAAAISRCIWLLVAELAIGKPPGGPGVAALAARGIGTLFVAGAVVPGKALRTIAKRTIAARPRRIAVMAARCAFKIAARRPAIVAFAGVRFARAGIGFFLIRFGAVRFAGVWSPLAVVALAGKAALGELLFRPPRRARTALAAAGAGFAATGPITPAARSALGRLPARNAIPRASRSRRSTR